MGERTQHAPGTHSWVDLATSDLGAAKAFYAGLFGWALDDRDAGGGRIYTNAAVGGRAVAGLYEDRESPAPPHWNCYVTVASADAAAGAVAAAGGTVVMAPFDVLDAGRMLVLQDPTGAFLALWEPRAHIGAELVNAHGALCWNDLSTSDPDAARRFYERLFGWTFEAVGTTEDYWAIQNGDRPNGGMRPFGPDEAAAGVPSNWMPYFAVDDLDRAVEAVRGGGGAVIVEPRALGEIARFSVVSDPQGAVFALYHGALQD